MPRKVVYCSHPQGSRLLRIVSDNSEIHDSYIRQLINYNPPAGLWAASASAADINAAIALALDGETVYVPGGSVTWNANVTVPSTKGVKVVGGTIGATNVNLNNVQTVFLDTRAANSPVRWSGFNFTNCPANAFTINYRTIGATNWRVDHCTWTGGALGSEIGVAGYTFGVFDHCTMTNCLRATWVDMDTRPEDITVPMNYPGGYSWMQPLGMGGAPHVYFEDCNFVDSTASIIHNMRAGARCVFRSCNFIGPMGIETHSGCSNGMRNPRWIEIYDCDFDLNGGAYWAAMFIRATNGMIFNNTMSAGYGISIRYDNETTCEYNSRCLAPWPSSQQLTYPGQDQIGAGRDTGWNTPQATDEAKLWMFNNLHGAAPAVPVNTICSAGQVLMQNNRDYWLQATPFTGASGIGVGLLSARPSSGLTTGVYYWATDARTLYRATSATTWATHYTPYTYPHPVTLL